MNSNFSARYGNVLIRPLEKKDIERLREWRNDPSQTKFLRNVGYITAEMQLKWYENYLCDNTQVIFAIEETKDLNRIVGSLAVYDINSDKKTAEIGKIQIGDTEAHGKGIGRVSLVMAMKVAIKKMNIIKIVGEVSPDNIQAYTNDMKVGFKIVGRHTNDMGIVEDEIELTESDLEKANAYYNEIEIMEI